MISEDVLGRSRLFRRLRTGPHGHIVELYAARLAREGFARHGTWRCLNVVGGFLDWIERSQLKLALLDERVAEKYHDHRGEKQCLQPGDRAALKRFLVVLRESDMIAPAPQPPITPEDRIFAGFSNYLRQERGLTPRSIITHQPVIRRFLREVSFEEPAHSALIQRVLAIPSKRHDKRQVHFLTRPEIEALLAAQDRTTWFGRRDHTLLLLAVQTGLRLSELINLDMDAIHLGVGAHVRCVGKGRQERCTPLTAHARGALKAWLKEPARHHANALFPNMHGGRLSADSIQAVLSKHVRMASERCPSLASKRVSPHVLRHSAAMELLQASVDCSVIALWLGHETVETTQTYLHAHLALKEAALTKLAPYRSDKPVRFRAGDRLLAFLEAL